MKKYLIILSFMVVAITQGSAQKLRLNGEVKGVRQGIVYLQKYIDRYYEVVDSAVIKDGRFCFNSEVVLPEVYGLSLHLSDTPFLLFLDKGDISVTLQPASGYRGSQVTGSGVHDLYTGFHKERQDLTTFISDHPQSLVSLYILYREFVSRLSSEDIQKNLSLLDASLQQHRFADILRQVISTRDRTDIGQLAPDFTALTPEGDSLSLHSLLGKGYLLLDFWASWCGPCRKENPNVVAAYREYKDKGFDILAVSLDKTREAWLKGIEQDSLAYHHVSELKFWNSDIARLYGIRAIPANLLLDKEGRVVAKNLRGTDLADTLSRLF